MSPSTPINREVVDDLGGRLAEELEMINRHFFVSNISEKKMLLKRLQGLAIHTNSSLFEVEMKI